jgi:hypothetical protein
VKNAVGAVSIESTRCSNGTVPDIAMPDLRRELAQCSHRHSMNDPCQVEYVDRLS